jgi:hypothetical protein
VVLLKKLIQPIKNVLTSCSSFIELALLPFLQMALLPLSMWRLCHHHDGVTAVVDAQASLPLSS